MTDDARGEYAAEFDPDDVIAEDEVTAADETPVPPQYGVGPFSVREAVLGGIWLVAFALSFVPLYIAGGGVAGPSVWTGGLDWILTVGVPTAAVFLLALRRLSPEGIRRVGSLGIDQFASVAFSVAAVFWLAMLWRLVAGLPPHLVATTWAVWVELILMLGGVFFTVVAPHIPVLGEDFRHRAEVLAHPNARPLRPIAARPPRPAEPVTHPGAVPGVQPADVPTQPYGAPTQAHGVPVPPVGEPAPVVDADRAAVDSTAETAVFEPVVIEDAAPAQAPQAFWALAPEERDVLDERGAPLFRIGPGAWALVIEDRGEVFVIRHEDGRLGYLHEVSGVTRG
ncbi:hypothetical protein [Microbacterium sp. SORGH_AS_0888]|uniref:hypothetical protein n=1 Tax=Microbacterium sp. SORGH_AS_0888 TaxID=3041791 RepID=UPI002782A78D|nr:hypothetical protein [Microbacterium sp. SORGH_AS_0888]MDQ1128869.1 hypothetical protein [Microbacterium sp. SORGH_AS_0888]